MEKKKRERKKIKYMIQAPWQCSGNLDQNQLHGNAVEIDGSKYQRQNLNPAAIRQSKQGNLKKYQREKPKKNKVITESDGSLFLAFYENEF
jgi:hypothetical protein